MGYKRPHLKRPPDHDDPGIDEPLPGNPVIIDCNIFLANRISLDAGEITDRIFAFRLKRHLDGCPDCLAVVEKNSKRPVL